MSIRYQVKTYSAATTVTTGTSSLLFGPIPVDWLDNFAINVKNCGATTLVLTVYASVDKARNIEDKFPLGSFTNTQAIAVKGGSTVIRTLYGDANPFKYITIFACATATVNTNDSFLAITGRAMK